ncbi:MAG: hypothetical protein IJ043_05395 [Clostridia bacterium]|nr:hypothetical protein [Clostridia bacterium]
MKRILCLLLALVLLTPAVFAEGEDLTFRMESAYGNVGDTVTVTASVQNAPVCASYRVIFTYDTAALEVVEGKNVDTAGLFIINVNATYDGQKAVNALSADAKKVIEGDMELFTVTFKIISETEGTEGALLKIVHEEFFGADLTRMTPAIEEARIYVGDDGTAPDETPNETPDETPGETPTETPDDSTGEPTDDPVTDAPAEDTPTEEESKKPTGSWAVDEKNEEIIHVEEDGTTTTYVPEFPEDLQTNVPTKIPLKTEEGKDAGSITVEKDEEGSITVIEQELKSPTAEEPGAPGRIEWPVVLGVAGVLLSAALIALLVWFIAKKKRGEHHE